jgi:hypothetical protein
MPTIAIVEQQQQQRAPSCTLHSKRYRRWHVQYEDFFMVSGFDVSNAAAVRAFETHTNARIAHLRRRYGIAQNALPSEDDLWMGMTLRQLEMLTVRTRCKSSYERCLADRSYDPDRPSLIELGFIKRRFIARPGDDVVTRPATTIYEVDMSDGSKDSFIVVDDDQGNYRGFDGRMHHAGRSGYTAIDRQYLYCFDAVNAAIAELDEEPPPKPLPRWRPVTVTRRGERSKGGAPVRGDDNHTTADDASENESLLISATRGGTTIMGTQQGSFANQNNIINYSVSTSNVVDNTNVSHNGRQMAELHSAPWTPETLIGLAGQLLAIPDPNAVDDSDAWEHDWLLPAQWLIDATKDLNPVRAWQAIERHIRGMLNGPTWYAQKRARAAPITLRHVVGTNKESGEFTGHNWRVVEAELDKAAWWHGESIPYDGPLLEALDYEQGYAAIDTPDQTVIDGDVEELASEDNSDEPTTDEVVAVTAASAQQQGMSAALIEDLVARTYRYFPSIILAKAQLASERYALCIRCGPDDWEDIYDFMAWCDLMETGGARIAQAVMYGRSLEAAHNNDPPLLGESEEDCDRRATYQGDHREAGVPADIPATYTAES